MSIVMPKCYQEGFCFAKNNGKCEVLTQPVKGKCCFQKPDRRITNGNVYPFVDSSCKSSKQ